MFEANACWMCPIAAPEGKSRDETLSSFGDRAFRTKFIPFFIPSSMPLENMEHLEHPILATAALAAVEEGAVPV